MSDSLGDGTGHPTNEQHNLYERWAEGGLAASIIGEVQGGAGYAEKPGNLVLNESSSFKPFEELATRGAQNGAHLWMQLGHAGALAYAPTSIPKGPSALNLPGLSCEELSTAEISQIPDEFARTAGLAKQVGVGGVQIHAAHGFLLSQFLSPLFNQRNDAYGESIENRARLLMETIEATRNAVGPGYPIAVKLNSSDQLESGFNEEDALKVVEMLQHSTIDLIDISGGTYFPGAKSASDGVKPGPYFAEFAQRARSVTSKPIMLTGGIKTHAQAAELISEKIVDIVGLARALVVEPSLPNLWMAGKLPNPDFPRFSHTPEGGVTAWYTMRLTEIGEGKDRSMSTDIDQALKNYDKRDELRTEIWLSHFGKSNAAN